MAVTDREFQLLLDGISRVETSLKEHVNAVERQRERVNHELEQIRDELQTLQVWKSKVIGFGSAAAGVVTILFEILKATIGHVVK